MCMCGDLYCGSCGPAQGNHKCGCCGRWSMDGECDDPDYCHQQLQLHAEAECEAWKSDNAPAL